MSDTEPRPPSELTPPGGKTLQRQQECKDCGTEYTARILYIYKTALDFSGGRCPSCDTKHIAEVAAEEEAERQMKLAQARRECRGKSGIALKFRAEDFSTFKHDPKEDKAHGWNLDEVFRRCWDYADGFPLDYKAHLKKMGKAYPSLLLYSVEGGGTDGWGVGKTHLVSAIAHRIIDRWQGDMTQGEIDMSSSIVNVVSEPELFAKIQATFNYSQEEKQRLPSADLIIKGFIWRPLLILDDVGKEERRETQFVQRTLFALVDGRYKLLRPMVITTNKSPERLREYLVGKTGDEAVYSRLLEMCGGQFLRIKGRDYRRKG